MKASYSPFLNAPHPTLQSDLQLLVSMIRERESSLVILLQEKQQKRWQRPQWLIKQCDYQQKQNRLSRQIRSIILRWVLLSGDQNLSEETMKHIRSFWIKIKMVMKMSLERMKLLNLLNYNLFQQYESIIEGMNMGYDRGYAIIHYRDIQQMIKNRNRHIHDLLLNSGLQLSVDNRYHIGGVKKYVKEFPSDSKIKSPNQNIKPYKSPLTIESKTINRPLSHQNHRNDLSKNMLQNRKIKKIEKFISNYEEKLKDVMPARIDLSLDKKKNLQQNLQTLYQNILQKNINNHRTISKFIFTHSGKTFKRLGSKRQIKTIQTKKIIENQSRKPSKKEGKKKIKYNFGNERAASAKLRRREMKQVYRLRHSQVFDQDIKLRSKKLLLR